jgi:hypothetical protein
MQVIHKYRIVVICLVVAGQILLYCLGATAKRNLVSRRQPVNAPDLREIVDSMAVCPVFSGCGEDDQSDDFSSREKEVFQVKSVIRIVF